MNDAAALMLVASLLCFVIVVMIQILPVGTCPQCPHCKAEERRKSDEQKALQRGYCFRCGTSHQEGKHDR